MPGTFSAAKTFFLMERAFCPAHARQRMPVGRHCLDVGQRRTDVEEEFLGVAETADSEEGPPAPRRGAAWS
ncbi:hypothetical protein C9I57_17145 [Trinickia symbiotica]|uniref:Uncharacterized protein n=1 Tax=Trinickia symbiotica TaxID=863227 RepID=A0A2T3XSH2_9BURK|nr:hypothetical protein C9I57_17145 [Trinickia symbiotica]